MKAPRSRTSSVKETAINTAIESNIDFEQAGGEYFSHRLPHSAVNEDTLSGIYHYRAVDDQLATSGQPTEAQLESIAAAGYTTVINLALHDDPRYSLPDEPATLHALGVAYEHIPVAFSAPTEFDLQAFFTAMKEHADEKIWIHCAANMRVSVFLGLYRVIERGWEQEKAFALMHDLWKPDRVWWSFIVDMLLKHRSR
ncbi:MAG TPA: protein tyrosine phosphatase family protein [Methylophilaceae bacterium]